MTTIWSRISYVHSCCRPEPVGKSKIGARVFGAGRLHSATSGLARPHHSVGTTRLAQPCHCSAAEHLTSYRAGHAERFCGAAIDGHHRHSKAPSQLESADTRVGAKDCGHHSEESPRRRQHALECADLSPAAE